MDDPALDREHHARALRSLVRINRILGVDGSLYSAVRRFGDKASVLDLGAGGGGFLEYLSSKGEGRLLLGLDISAFALQQIRLGHGRVIECVLADARWTPFADESVDVVSSSLLLHHFDEEDALRILREAARVARRGVVFGDLSRSRTAWLLTWITTRLTSRSRVFRVDGRRSVRAAFRRDELAVLAQRAGLHGAKLKRRFPFRLLLVWCKKGRTLG